MSAPLSVRAYAAHRKAKGLRGQSRQAVERAIRDGRISRTAEGKIDPEVADAEWDGSTLEQAAPVDGSDAPASSAPRQPSEASQYGKARAVRESYKAQREKLELQRLQGILHRKDECEQEAFRRSRQLRDRILGVPTRVAGQIAMETDPRKCEQIILGELRDAISAIIDGD